MKVVLEEGGSGWIQIHQFCYNDPKNIVPVTTFSRRHFFSFSLKKKKMYRQNFPEAIESDEMSFT